MHWDDGEPRTPTDLKRELLKAVLALPLLAFVFGAWVLLLWLLSPA